MVLLILKYIIINTEKIPLITKIYVWSLLFEPFIYFVKAGGGQESGIPISVSKILQILVILLFIQQIFSNKLNLNFNKKSLSINFFIYLLIIVLSTFFAFTIFNSYNINFKTSNLVETSGDTPLLKSQFIRPFFDFINLIYYYFYFILLFTKLITNKLFLNYFFKYFILTFKLALGLGFLDLLFVYFSGEALLKRHFDQDTDVGFRFHSFLGEPRDAFVFLIYSILLLYLINEKFYRIKYFNSIISISIFSLILTQSASGLIGIFVGSILILIYYLIKLNKYSLYLFCSIIILLILAVILIPQSPRIMIYIESFSELFDYLKSGGELPYYILVQSVNVLPIWGLYNHLFDNLYRVFFGSGISASAYYNMNYIGDIGYSNPNSQFTRIIYDSGIIGFLFNLKFLITTPLKITKQLLTTKKMNKIITIFLIFSSSALIHRSLLPLIIVGLFTTLPFIYNLNIKLNEKLN